MQIKLADLEVKESSDGKYFKGDLCPVANSDVVTMEVRKIGTEYQLYLVTDEGLESEIDALEALREKVDAFVSQELS